MQFCYFWTLKINVSDNNFLNNHYAKTSFENWLISHVRDLAFWNPGKIIFWNFLRPCPGLENMKIKFKKRTKSGLSKQPHTQTQPTQHWFLPWSQCGGQFALAVGNNVPLVVNVISTKDYFCNFLPIVCPLPYFFFTLSCFAPITSHVMSTKE